MRLIYSEIWLNPRMFQAILGFFAMLFLLQGQVIGQDYEYIQYTTKDGLPSNYVYGAIEDNQGQIWVYTENGIAKFDGYEFKKYGIKEGLPGLDVTYVQKDKKGRIWANVYRNKPAYIYQDSIFTPFDYTAHFRNLVYGLPQFIYGSGEYAYLIDKEKSKSINYQAEVDTQKPFTIVSKPPVNFYLNADIQKFIWTNGKESSFFAQNDFSIFPAKAGGNLSIFQIETSNRYFISYHPNKEAVHFLDIDKDISKPIYLFEEQIYPKAFIVLSILDSSVMINTDQGYLEYDFDAQLMDKFLLSNIGSNYELMRAFKDSKENLWVGSKNAGLFLIPNRSRNSYRLNAPEINGKSFESLILSEKGHLFGITDFSSIYWINGKNTELLYQPRSKERFRYSLKTPLGIMVSTQLEENLIIAYEDVQPMVKPMQEVIKVNFVPTLEAYKDYGPAGMAFLKNNTGGTFSEKENTIYAYGINGIAYRYTINANRINASAMRLGINVFHYHRTEEELYGGNAENIFLIKKGKLLPLDSTGVITNVRCIYDTPNALWIGTENGLYQYDLKTKNIQTVLNDVVVRKIKQRDRHSILLATNSGVFILPTDAKSQGFILYGEKDGLPTNEVRDVISYQDSLLYVATANGIHIINQNKNYKAQLNPDDLSIQSLQMSGTSFTTDDKLNFSHQQNDLDVHYHLNSFASAGDITYYRKLEPIESEWRMSKERQVSYPSLSPGHYTFNLKAKDTYGQEVMLQPISFTIKKPFWTTHVFIASAVAALIGLVLLFVQLREKQQRKKLKEEKKLNRRIAQLELSALRAQINPHFVFNALGSIQYYIQTKEVESADSYLTKFALLMRKYLDSSKEKLIPLRQELELIRFYTELEKLRFEDLFEVQIEVARELDLDNTFIPSMLIQPFIENAILHGLDTRRDGKGLLAVKFNAEQNVLHIQIEDNGIGFEQAKRNRKKGHRSKGMEIIQEKIQTLRASQLADVQLEIKNLHLNDPIFPGTQVSLAIKILDNEES